MFPNNVTGNGSVNLLTGGNNGLLGLHLGNVLNTFKLNAPLQAAENEGLINVLSAPKIATLNNEPAEIQSGLQIPIQTVANNTVTVQFVNATLRLDGDAARHRRGHGADGDRRPEARAAARLRDRRRHQRADRRPRKRSTRVIVRDGGTTVIGGIYKVSTDQGQDRVPGLANIPILGSLFKNKRRERPQRRTPDLHHPAGDQALGTQGRIPT